jgi:desulfoferrodoxin (superoxide reductase-like protein)
MSTYFSADARSLIKSMLETDPKKRIKVYNAEIIHVMTGTLFINSVSLKMDDVIRHPWFTKETHYTLPMNIPEMPCQYNESIELERNTLNTMKTLLDCNMSSTILSALCSNRYGIIQEVMLQLTTHHF